tara:strand:- start:274 stop:432 length:159 start_codon:yes stop_codon:yes gene_type:complete
MNGVTKFSPEKRNFNLKFEFGPEISTELVLHSSRRSSDSVAATTPSQQQPAG